MLPWLGLRKTEAKFSPHGDEKASSSNGKKISYTNKGRFFMKLFKTAAAAILGLAMMAGMASAQSAMNFEFEENGSASGEFEMNFTESSETTWTGGSEYTFNGGAGSEGKAVAEADDYTLAVGVTGQYAGGTGNAYSNTLGTNYAEASYGSGSFNANGALAFDDGSGKSKVEYNGSALAGGAGSAGSGLSVGTAYEYSVAGDASGKYKLKMDRSYGPNN